MSSALQRSATRRTTVTGLVAAIIAAVCLALVPSAHAAKGMEVSLQDEGVFTTGSTPFPKDRAYSLLKGLQVSRLRFSAIWGSLNIASQRCSRTVPKTPQYDFSRLDAAIDSARSNNLKVLLTITGGSTNPAWGSGKKTCAVRTNGNDYKPNAREFGKFAKIVAAHYKGRVDQYSIWNEPNRKGWIEPVSQSATIYRDLYTQGYKGVRAADKKAKIFIGELAPYASKPGVALEPLDFLRKLTCVNASYRSVKRCAGLKADGFAYHPYDFSRSPTQRFPNKDAVTIANLPALTSALDKLAKVKRLNPVKGSKLSLYLTEYGYFGTKEPGGKAKVFPESTRAKYLVQAFKKAQANPRVKQMLEFLLVRYPGAGTRNPPFDFDTSIVKLDGTKLASYTALARWASSAAKKGDIKKAPQ